MENVRINQFSEWHTVKCIQEYKIEYKTCSTTFRKGEQYEASKINDNWWLVDQFGVSSEDFKKYFKDI